ncbi:hypothetical protein [Thermaurantiacus sp.]
MSEPRREAGPEAGPPSGWIDPSRTARVPAESHRALAAARRRLKLRAVLDAAWLGALVAGMPFLFAQTLDALVATLAAGGGAIVIYMGRRNQDLERYAEDARTRNARFRSRGISLSDWHAGASVPPWEERAHPSTASS